MRTQVRSMEWKGDALLLLEQRKLPGTIEMVECRTYRDVALCIKDMVVRGAPAIGAAAAYGVVLGAQELARQDSDVSSALEGLDAVAGLLAGTRPTAVNLFWAIDRMMRVAKAALTEGVLSAQDLAVHLEREACAIATEDVEANTRLGAHGAALMPRQGGVLTHCNAGALATVGFGTALGVIRAAYAQGAAFRVYADETRPYMQGTRLTTWELMQDDIPVTLITDNMAGYCMQQGLIHAVVVGADRVAADGDAANKIGTYSVAVLANYHHIPFYVAAPRSTIDLDLTSGDSIPIEQRNLQEVTHWRGDRIAPEGVDALNPAFDVTPAHLITAIVTEVGVVRAPYTEGLRRIMAL